MGCATKNAKVVAISLGSLQRLISLKAVPQSAVPLIINTMNDAMSQGVDIQLRILQTLVSLVPNFPAIHGDLLGDVRVARTFGRSGDLRLFWTGAVVVLQAAGVPHRGGVINCGRDIAAIGHVCGGQDGVGRPVGGSRRDSSISAQGSPAPRWRDQTPRPIRERRVFGV